MTPPSQPDPPDPTRGTDPPTVIPTPPPAAPPLDPAFKPDPTLLKSLVANYRTKADKGRLNREDVLPYLLVRAFTPGDRGARPTWPPTPCWESPDVLLIDASYTGPFDPARCIATPVSGTTYRVFVRTFNLGMLPALGTQVTAYWIDPGFWGGQAGQEPNLIGSAYVEVADRSRPESVQVVEVQPPWAIPFSLTGHECLMATASCVADPWRAGFDANNDRHVAQRNLTVAVGHMNLDTLIGQLAGQIPTGGALEVMHGGPAVVALLAAVCDGKILPGGSSTGEPVVAPALADIRQGILTDGGLHLMTAVRKDAAFVVAPAEVVLAATEGASPAAPTAMLRNATAARLDTMALTGGNDEAPSVLSRAITRMLDIGNAEAGSIAAALGGPPASAHLLRFVASDAMDALVGGYSIVVAQG